MAPKKPTKKRAAPAAPSRAADVPIEEFREIAARQSASLRSAAEKLERGEPLANSLEQHFAAGALRWAAELIENGEPAPRRGRPPKIDPMSVRVEFELLKLQSNGEPEARAILAERHRVDESTINRALAATAEWTLIPRPAQK